MKKSIMARMNRTALILMITILAFGSVWIIILANESGSETTGVQTDIESIDDAGAKVDGEVATIEGIVTVDSKAISNGEQYATYIQDETGGINVFAFEKGSFPNVQKGDEIKLAGELKTHRGLKEIIPTSVDVIATGKDLPVAKMLTLKELQDKGTADKYEGQRVKVRGFVRQVPSSLSGGGYNLSFVDEAYNGTTVRVMENALDIKSIEEGKWYELTAIVGVFDSFQLIPTEVSDFVLSDEQSELPSPEGSYKAVVGSITDGDTIVLENPVIGTTRVRLINMDTAETYPARTKDPSRSEISVNQKHHGDVATEYMQELISVGDEVTLEVGEEAIDDYGRLLAEVVREDGLNLNLEMVKKGHAVTYFIAPINEKAYPTYQEAVREAKEAGLGIWNPEDPILEQPFEFRVNDDGKKMNKIVGHSDTFTYVEPNDWEAVPVDKRIFFWNKSEAEAFGYTKNSGTITDLEPLAISYKLYSFVHAFMRS